MPKDRADLARCSMSPVATPDEQAPLEILDRSLSLLGDPDDWRRIRDDLLGTAIYPFTCGVVWFGLRRPSA
jgi:hypothetical protein